jgi:hypothetical protein
MSRLRINHQKSEAFFMGASEEEQNKVANILNCNVG